MVRQEAQQQCVFSFFSTIAALCGNNCLLCLCPPLFFTSNSHYSHFTLSPSLSLFLCHCCGREGGKGRGGGEVQACEGDKVQANGRKSLKFAAAAFHLDTEGPPLGHRPPL